jgi:two-component system sensor kinase FixL
MDHDRDHSPEHARAEAEREDLFRLNAEQLGDFVEQTPVAMAMFDRDMRYLASSARWREDYGLSRDVIGKSHDAVIPGAGQAWKQVHRRVLGGERVRCDRDKFVRDDGSVQWLRWEAHPWRNPHDGIGGVILWSEDISERLRIEAALHDNERRLKAIVDAAMEAVISIDASGVIQSANPAAAEMFGLALEDMLGRNVGVLMPATYRDAHDGYIKSYLNSRERKIIGMRRRVEGRRSNGETFPLEATVTEATLEGQPLFVGFLRDLSPIEEEKRRVNALREELAHVSRLNDMGEVVTGLAHDVGQPVAAILNFAAAHRRAMTATGKSPEQELITKIEAQARRAAEILKRLRGFIEKRPPERTVELVQALIDDAIKLSVLRSRARVRHVSRRRDESDGRVFVDRVQIGQVLVNLLRNADDAVIDEFDPEIVIETALVGPDRIRVAIADNGDGVDPEIAANLFSAFFSTRKFGMGVGLALGKSIVEAHGGVISYRPNAPRGSIFEFTLPLFREAGEKSGGREEAAERKL